MRKIAKRAAAGLAAALITTLTATVPASPAAAADSVEIPPYTGLVFYSTNPVKAVDSLAAPDNICRKVAPEATWVFPHSGGFRSVHGYKTPDCSGTGTELNNFHTWTKGDHLTYRAFV